MITVIAHPSRFMTGTRCLMLKSRHKDGNVDERTILRVSHDEEGFQRQLAALYEMMEPNERIYASAGERDVNKAIRIFKERQLAADYDGDPADFYRHIETRWYACLMSPQAQLEKLWVFDCDEAGDAETAMDEYMTNGRSTAEPYVYPSKSGQHIIVPPFDRQRLTPRVRAFLHDNAIMLWAYAAGDNGA